MPLLQAPTAVDSRSLNRLVEGIISEIKCQTHHNAGLSSAVGREARTGCRSEIVMDLKDWTEAAYAFNVSLLSERTYTSSSGAPCERQTNLSDRERGKDCADQKRSPNVTQLLVPWRQSLKRKKGKGVVPYISRDIAELALSVPWTMAEEDAPQRIPDLAFHKRSTKSYIAPSFLAALHLIHHTLARAFNLLLTRLLIGRGKMGVQPTGPTVRAPQKHVALASG